MAEYNVKFVGQKLSKIRWRPTQAQSVIQSDVFATGSWDDEENKICLWGLEQLGEREGPASLLDSEPRELCHVTQIGDVTDLCFLSVDQLAASSSTGSITVYKHHHNSQTLSVGHSWEGVHKAGGRSCPCTCLATSPKGEDLLVSGGEDGRLLVLNVNRRQPDRIINTADSCTINAAIFLKQMEVLTVNSFGQLKIFDLRQKNDDPAKTYTVTEEHTSLQCVAKHPGQPHIVATGGRDGMLTIWDLRQERFPMTLLEAHSATMWEVKFHPHNPDHLLTCSEDGSVWHWDGTALKTSVPQAFTSGNRGESSLGHASSWLNLETARQKLDITSLLPTRSLPVNSLDIDRDTLLCGTDSETLYTISLPGLV